MVNLSLRCKRCIGELYAKGMVFEFVDKSLNPNNYDVEDVKKVIGIALMCTQASAAMRPAMSDVVVLLNGNDLLEHMRPSMPILIQSNLRSDKDISASIGSLDGKKEELGFLFRAEDFQMFP